jgi:DNA-binding response OmpR family regulator
MTCPRCETLARELAELRGSIGALEDDSAPTVARRFRMSFMDARLTMRLYAAAGRSVQTYALEEELLGDDPAPETLRVHIYRIRQALGGDAIETVRDVGYRLTPLGRAKIYQTLNQERAA